MKELKTWSVVVWLVCLTYHTPDIAAAQSSSQMTATNGPELELMSLDDLHRATMIEEEARVFEAPGSALALRLGVSLLAAAQYEETIRESALLLTPVLDGALGWRRGVWDAALVSLSVAAPSVATGATRGGIEARHDGRVQLAVGEPEDGALGVDLILESHLDATSQGRPLGRRAWRAAAAYVTGEVEATARPRYGLSDDFGITAPVTYRVSGTQYLERPSLLESEIEHEVRGGLEATFYGLQAVDNGLLFVDLGYRNQTLNAAAVSGAGCARGDAPSRCLVETSGGATASGIEGLTLRGGLSPGFHLFAEDIGLRVSGELWVGGDWVKHETSGEETSVLALGIGVSATIPIDADLPIELTLMVSGERRARPTPNGDQVAESARVESGAEVVFVTLHNALRVRHVSDWLEVKERFDTLTLGHHQSVMVEWGFDLPLGLEAGVYHSSSTDSTRSPTRWPIEGADAWVHRSGGYLAWAWDDTSTR